MIGSTLTGPLTIRVWRTCTSICRKRSQFLEPLSAGWKDRLRDKWIIARTDNTTLSAINTGTSSHQLAIQWLRKLFWPSATYNFPVTSRYIPTAANTLADAISRIHDPAHCALLMRGIKRLQSKVVRQKLPITPDILHKLHGQLDLTNSLDDARHRLLLFLLEV